MPESSDDERDIKPGRGRPRHTSDPKRLLKDAMFMALATLDPDETVPQSDLARLANLFVDPASTPAARKTAEGLVLSLTPPQNQTAEKIENAMRYTRARMTGSAANCYTDAEEKFVVASVHAIAMILRLPWPPLSGPLAAFLTGLNSETLPVPDLPTSVRWDPKVVKRVVEFAQAANGRRFRN